MASPLETIGAQGGSPYAQYLEALNLPLGAYSPAQGFQRSMYQPWQNLFGMEQQFAPTAGYSEPGVWSDYLKRAVGDPTTGGNVGRGIGNLYQRAGQLLAGLYGAGATKRASQFQSFQPSYGEGGEYTGDVGIGTQQELLRQALRPYYGYQGAQRFASNIPREQAQYLRLSEGIGQPESFLDWLRRKYDLGKYFGEAVPQQPAAAIGQAPPPAAASGAIDTRAEAAANLGMTLADYNALIERTLV